MGVAQSEEEGLEPTKEWVKDLVDEIIAEEFASPDLELVWEDEDTDAAQAEARVKLGTVTLKEMRDSLGLDPTPTPPPIGRWCSPRPGMCRSRRGWVETVRSPNQRKSLKNTVPTNRACRPVFQAVVSGRVRVELVRQAIQVKSQFTMALRDRCNMLPGIPEYAPTLQSRVPPERRIAIKSTLQP